MTRLYPIAILFAAVLTSAFARAQFSPSLGNQFFFSGGLVSAPEIPIDSFAPPIPQWVRGPGAADRFFPAFVYPEPKNDFLAAMLAAIAYPINVGMENYWDTSIERAEYRRRVKALLSNRSNNNEGWGFDKVTFVRNGTTDTEGFIASCDDYTIVSFRGSESLPNPESFAKDWIGSDFNAPPVPYAGGFVHQGFKASADSVYAQVRDQLRFDHGYFSAINQKPIWVVGHSLGGAIAVLTAHRLKTEALLPVLGANTQGQPMVGNPAFRNSYRSQLFLIRAINCRDIVSQAFGELDLIPTDMTWVGVNLADYVLRNVSATGSQSQLPNEVAALIAWIVDGGKLLFDEVTEQDLVAQGAWNYVHWGQLIYFDRDGNVVSDPTLTERRDDRIAAYSRDLEPLVDPFVLPAMPSGSFSFFAWRQYQSQIAGIAWEAFQTILNPGPFLGQVLGVTTVGIDAEHHPWNYLRLLHGRIPTSLHSWLPGVPPAY